MKKKPVVHRDDLLDMVLSDPVADSVVRLLTVGYGAGEIENSMHRGLLNGLSEYLDGRRSHGKADK